MLYTIFDVETTGFSGTADSVCQFAAITVNQNFFPVRTHNYYFYKEGMPWSDSAEAVHGLSRDFLKQYESEYNDNLIRMYTVLQHGNLAGHNCKGFDIPFVSQFLRREGLPELVVADCLDTMILWRPEFKKRMKLVDLPGALGITEEQVLNTAKILFKKYPGERRPHDACYDTTATLLCLRVAAQRGLCSLNRQAASTGAGAVKIML